jgi:hypothetical protein
MELTAPTVSPWRSIWVAPRETIRGLVETDASRYVIALGALEGIGQALNEASDRDAGDTASVLGLLALCLAFGAIGGIVSLHLGALLFRWTGGWLGGKARFREARAALAWSFVPTVWILPLWLPALLLFGRELFTRATPSIDANPALGIGLLAFGYFHIVAAIWSVVILLKCLSEVHGFSVWRAFFSLILTMLVMTIPILVFWGLWSLA